MGETDAMRLLIVRHGETTANVAGQLDTRPPGAALTDLGRRQAGALVDAVRRRCPSVAAIVVSDALRTHRTAAPLADALGLEVVEEAGVREVQAGDLEMAADQESVESYIGTVRRWLEGDPGARMPGGESGTEFLARFDDVVRRVAAAADPQDLVVLVSHGSAIRTWVTLRAAGVDPAVVQQRLHNTAAVEVEGDPDAGWRLVLWHAEPLGGAALDDPDAPDPTGRD